MAEAQIKLGYIVEPFAQFENTNGKPIVGGHLEVFIAGTDEKYITYQNFDFTQNPFKIPLGSDGRVVVLGDSELAYDVYAYDSFNNLVCSRLNVAAGDAGGVSNGGLKEVLHDSTLTGKGTQLSPLGVSPLTNLAVDETMTAYSATVAGKDSLVLGVNGDWFYNEFGSAFSGKLDTSSFNSAFVGIKGELSSKVDWSAMSSYYNKNETYNYFLPRSAIDLNNYYTKNETYSQEEIMTFMDRKQDKLTFGYNENNEISSINNSAIDNPWISGTTLISAIGYIQPGQTIQAVSSMELSGNKNHFIGLKGTKFMFPTVDMLSAWLELSGVMAQSSFDIFYSGAYQPAINDLYNSANFNTTNKLDISSFADISGSFLTAHQDISNKLDTSSFADVSGTFLTAHQDISNKLDVSAFSDVSGYFLQANDITGKQDKLTFNYTTENEISGINNSAIYSPGGEGGDCPWISGGKIIEDTQLLTANMIIQTLSSFTVSGDKNHFIAVKGGKYQFPNQWQLASAIDETQWFAKASALSSYTPLSSYTATISDLYTSASWMMANKLDSSAATGGQVETAYLPLSSLGDSVGSGNLNFGDINYAFGADNDVRGINDFVAGSGNSAGADLNTVLFGVGNNGNKNVLVLGSGNVGLGNSLVLGQSCSSNGDSLSLGESAYSNWHSVAVGSSVNATDYSLAIGRDTSADYMAMAVGNQNSAYYHSFAVGTQNIADSYSMVAGDSNSGYMSVIAGGTNADISGSVVVGNSNGNCKCSLVIGDFNSGCNSGICVGGSNTCDMYSVTIGQDNKVGWKSMAIGNGLRLDRWSNGIAVGKYNKTSAACFVVGNGDADDDRSDLVVIDENGIVSASDVAIPGGITLATLYNAFTAYTANHP